MPDNSRVDDPEEIMSTAQVAAELKVSDARVRRLLLDGALRGEKVGRDWIVRRKNVEEYLEQLRQDAQSGRKRGPKPKSV